MALDFSQILVVGVSLKSSEHFNSFFFEFRESKPPLTKVFERGSKVINFGTVDNQKRSCDWLSSFTSMASYCALCLSISNCNSLLIFWV